MVFELVDNKSFESIVNKDGFDKLEDAKYFIEDMKSTFRHRNSDMYIFKLVEENMKHNCKYCGKEITLREYEESVVKAHLTDTICDLDADGDTNVSPYSCEIVSRPVHCCNGEYMGDIRPLFAELMTDMCNKCSKELDSVIKTAISNFKKSKGVI